MRQYRGRNSSVHNYHYRPTLPAHIAKATVVRESDELVIEARNAPEVDVELCWLVASPNRTSLLFHHRYYVVAQVDGEWRCSSQDETLAPKLIEQVKQYLLDQANANAQEATEGRYYPVFRIGQQWFRFQSRGQDVSFASEAEARAYLIGVAGDTSVEHEPCND